MIASKYKSKTIFNKGSKQVLTRVVNKSSILDTKIS